jgi:hypothetical protein
MADRGIIGINRVVLFNTSFAWAIYGLISAAFSRDLLKLL